MDNTGTTPSFRIQGEELSRKISEKKCLIESCEREFHCKGMCKIHYNSLKRKEKRAQIRVQKKRYRQKLKNDPVRLARYKEKAKENYHKNKETIRIRQREWYARKRVENPEYIKEMSKRSNLRAKEALRKRLLEDPVYKEKYNEKARTKSRNQARKNQAQKDMRTAILKNSPVEDVWKAIGYTPGEKKDEIPSESNGD